MSNKEFTILKAAIKYQGLTRDNLINEKGSQIQIAGKTYTITACGVSTTPQNYAKSVGEFFTHRLAYGTIKSRSDQINRTFNKAAKNRKDSPTDKTTGNGTPENHKTLSSPPRSESHKDGVSSHRHTPQKHRPSIADILTSYENPNVRRHSMTTSRNHDTIKFPGASNFLTAAIEELDNKTEKSDAPTLTLLQQILEIIKEILKSLQEKNKDDDEANTSATNNASRRNSANHITPAATPPVVSLNASSIDDDDEVNNQDDFLANFIPDNLLIGNPREASTPKNTFNNTSQNSLTDQIPGTTPTSRQITEAIKNLANQLNISDDDEVNTGATNNASRRNSANNHITPALFGRGESRGFVRCEILSQ